MLTVQDTVFCVSFDVRTTETVVVSPGVTSILCELSPGLTALPLLNENSEFLTEDLPASFTNDDFSIVNDAFPSFTVDV